MMPESLASTLVRPEFWVIGLGLASFLALTWLLRGAPLGQVVRDETEESSTPLGARDRSVIAAVVGFLLVVGGGVVVAVHGVPWSLPLFVLGFGAMLAVGKLNRRRRHESPTLSRVVSFADSALMLTLLGGILIVANLLAFRYGGRPLDLTREGTFSLSQLTVDQIRSLRKPVTFSVVAADSRVQRVAGLLDLYRAENPDQVRVERIDPYADPAAFEELARRAPDLAINPRGGAVVVQYGEGDSAARVVVRSADLFENPRSDPSVPRPPRFESRFRGEDTLTSALIRLREGKTSTIVFTTGHGEPPTGQIDPAQSGLGLVAARLSALGSRVVDLPTGPSEMPQDAELVVIAGPQSPFSAAELARLNAYLSRGGRLLVMLDNRKSYGLEPLLSGFEIELGKGLVVDPTVNYERRPEFVAAPISGNQARHAIVENLINRAIVFPSAAPLLIPGARPDVPGAPTANSAFFVEPVVLSSSSAWAESDPGDPRLRRDEGKDTPGPLPLAVAASDRPASGASAPTPRLVVVGSRYAADNVFVSRNESNLDFIVNCVSWLRGRADLQGIPPKTHVGLTLTADPTLRGKLVVIPTILAVAVIVGLGIAVYLARRS